MQRRALFSLMFVVVAAACGEGPDGGPDGGTTTPDGGTTTPDGGTGETCGPPSTVAAGTCAVTQGDANVLLKGTILAPEGELRNGQLLVGANGTILCASCSCADQPAAASATVVDCGGAVVSPGLINAHDHITFTQLEPAQHGEERYDHRHDWRKGKRGHTKLSSPSKPAAVPWGELRQVMGGATSLIGSGGAAGLMRNLDEAGAKQEGLNLPAAEYETFPLGDNDGELIANGCNYPEFVSFPTSAAAYFPHVSEGIDFEAHNEFVCLSSDANGGQDHVRAQSAFIHAVGLLPQDFETMAKDGTAMVWSPRSNVDLYGMTASVTVAARAGVQIALGTDWTASGSMNVLRELKCADSLNTNHYGKFFTDRQLWEMSTSTAAAVTATDAKLGRLAPGFLADIAIFDGSRAANGYRAVIEAEVSDVLLVLRGGKVLYGDATAVDGLGSTDCEAIDVCSKSRKACAKRETGKTIAELKTAAGGNPYALFFCGAPEKEPSCVPMRPGEFGESTPDDVDGDGVPNATDLCSTVFDPARPLDRGQQGDADKDGEGDACDPCPLNADSTTCTPAPTDDADLDGKKDAEDNCPSVPNPQQEDGDEDGIGDVCDACPTANPGGSACPTTIYAVKQGTASGKVAINDVVVTGVGGNGYFVQHVPGGPGYVNADFSGLFVFTGSGEKPPANERVSLVGDVTEFFGQKQVSNVVATRLGSTSAPEPVVALAADVATGGARAAALEGVLVRVESATVASITPAAEGGDRAPTNEFTIDGNLRVNDFIYLVDPFPTVGERLTHVTGVLRLANSNSKLEPRGEQDLGRKPYLASLTPVDAWLPIGGSGVTLTVSLSGPAAADTDVALSSSDEALEVPPSVKVLAGASSATFEGIANAQPSAPVTITASFDGVELDATVRVYDPAATRLIASFTASAAQVRPGAPVTVTVKLDAPAGPDGATVTLAATAGLVTPESVELAFEENQLEATASFTYAAEGTVTVTATLGDDVATLTLEAIGVVPARAPAAGDLLVTEVMYDPTLSGADQADEWFEIFNASSDPIALDDVSIADTGGTPFTVTAGLVLEPGAYGVFANSADAATRLGLQNVLMSYGTLSPSLALANGGDTVTLKFGTVTIDTTTTGDPAKAGEAVCRKADGSWGVAVSSWTGGPAGDKGSPGASNEGNCQ